CRKTPEPYVCFAKLPMHVEGRTLVGTTEGAKDVPKLENGWNMELHLYVIDASGVRLEPTENAPYSFTVGAAQGVAGFEAVALLVAALAGAVVVRRR
ncbi:MAG TPA: hypothetical protein VI565_00935, partial [Burkholderiales bacterium]|nr:hypothetical protein [Burkholderiales bacterium]